MAVAAHLYYPILKALLYPAGKQPFRQTSTRALVAGNNWQIVSPDSEALASATTLTSGYPQLAPHLPSAIMTAGSRDSQLTRGVFMTHSLSQQLVLTCLDCRASFEMEVWLIVNNNERPDLLACMRDSTLHDVIDELNM